MSITNYLRNHKVLPFISLALVLTLVLSASLVAQHRGFGRGPGMGFDRGGDFPFQGLLAEHLELTDAQREQAKALQQAARAESQPLHQQLRQLHQEMQTAIETGQPDATLQSLATRQGELMGVLAGIRARTQAQMYAILTPDQKAKLTQLREKRQQRREELKNQFQERRKQN